jgi:SAM-dependent methyltransferase
MPMPTDVPSPIDLRCLPDAIEWEHSALDKRPWRTEFFKRFSEEMLAVSPPLRTELELGSGPGFLAEHLLAALANVHYELLDFSLAMHQLAKARLGAFADRVQYSERSFKAPDWTQGLGTYDCIVTNQTVHELRHKCHATALHTQARTLLSTGGSYLVCDHFVGEGGMKNTDLYTSIEEQRQALLNAGFSSAQQLLVKGGMVLHKAL